MKTLVGPFSQIITMKGIPMGGPAGDDKLEIIPNGGILLDKNLISAIGDFDTLRKKPEVITEEISGALVILPGFIDAHTHLCYAGSRAGDYAQRIAGRTYQEILDKGGGIHDTVNQTRRASSGELAAATGSRINRHFMKGVTTIEIKSGYGLNMPDELKMLEVIKQLDRELPPDLVPTCLAAHVLPGEWDSSADYLQHLLADLLPEIKARELSHRVDIFIEKEAFGVEEAYRYLSAAKKSGFDVTVHADQFTRAGSAVAAKIPAVSADHLETIDDAHIKLLTDRDIVQTVLPGASMGLGMPFAPARKILDAGGCLVIASDWNPGSAPMGDLLTEAALLSAYEKLTFAETMAGLTFRAASALSLTDRGHLASGMKADFIGFPADDYREILYHQGQLQPAIIWKNGIIYENK